MPPRPTPPAKAVARNAEGPIRRTIDITELRPGEQPKVPWLADGRIRHEAATTPVGPAPVRSFVAVSGGYVVQRQVDDDEGTSTLELVRRDGDVRTLATGPVSEPVARPSGEQFVWTVPDTDPDGKHVIRIFAADGTSGRPEPVVGGIVHRRDYRPVGYLGFLGVAFAAEGDAEVQAYDPDTTSYYLWADTLGVTATADGPGTAAFVTRYDEQDRPCTSTGFVDEFGIEEQWASCAITPISFSPDGGLAVAVDSRTDGLGNGKLLVVDATTGTVRLDLDVELSQRVAWESEESLVFDAWNGTEMALVRCTVVGTCERAGEIRPNDPADAGQPPYLLPRQ